MKKSNKSLKNKMKEKALKKIQKKSNRPKTKLLKTQPKTPQISPEEALDFIDSYQKMLADLDEPTQSISLRIPGNLLRALKIKAKSENKKYQSMIIEMIRSDLKRS